MFTRSLSGLLHELTQAIVHMRMTTRGLFHRPPIATDVVYDEGAALIGE